MTQEEMRLSLQARLDAEKQPAERNRLGQFATPPSLANEIVEFGLNLLGTDRPIHFLDPAFGTGSFFSALLRAVPKHRIEKAKGFELDFHYGAPARELWRETPLDLQLTDFTRIDGPAEETHRFNLLICNPPYVRHHHILNQEKVRLQSVAKAVCGMHISGLAGLYCYFICMSHRWMQVGALAGWLIPSEFMDVNYGQVVKRYLLEQVTLLRIHRFQPNDVQFDDALVSSAIVWFRNFPPPSSHEVEFTFGGTLTAPMVARKFLAPSIRNETKWTRFPIAEVRKKTVQCRLSDLFTIKRGIATGSNKFFILTRKEIEAHGIPFKFFRPILPSPRYVPIDEINSDPSGLPILERQLFLLDCRLNESVVKERFPKLWTYLQNGKHSISERYLCRSRKVWYFQEERPPAPILCTYLGRGDAKSGRPFRFILNHSKATAANVYLLLYPKVMISAAMSRDKLLLRQIWRVLNNLNPASVLGEGRVYGGGLHKLEPKELGNVDATPILDIASELRAIPCGRILGGREGLQAPLL